MGDSTPTENEKSLDKNQVDEEKPENEEKTFVEKTEISSNGELEIAKPVEETIAKADEKSGTHTNMASEVPKEDLKSTTEIAEEPLDKSDKENSEEKPAEENHKNKEPKENERITRGKKRKLEDSKEVIESENEPQDTSNEKGVENDSVDLNQTADLSLSKKTDPMGKGKRARIPNKRYSDILLSASNRKSLDHPPGLNETNISTSKIQQEEVPIKEEVMSYVSDDIASISSKKNKSTPAPNLSDAKYLKPFDFGWKRELVWRSTSSNTKRQGDIYYYTPNGKKVRSFREVSENLSKTNRKLTLDNFTFFKDSLGVNDPSKEIIRDAKFKVVGVSPSPKVTPKKLPEKRSANTTLTPKLAPKLSTPTSATPIRTKIGQRTPLSKNKVAMKSHKKPTPKAEESPIEIDKPVAKSTPVRKATKVSKQLTESAPSKPKTRNLKLSNLTNSGGPTEERSETRFMENYLQNLSFGYNTLLYVFQYLKVQDLLRAGCVCTMWRDIASHPILWRTVRMKNSQVHSFEGLANTLKKHGTRHLDLRKMLLPSAGDEIWPEFSKAIARVDTLSKIELCRCPATVVEQLAASNPNLEVINAVTIRCESMNLDPLRSLTNIKELRLKATSGLTVPSIDSLESLTTLQQLSLTSVNELHKLNLKVLENLVNLRVLELGECVDFPKSFGENILVKLNKLEKLRLEKGQGNCCTFEILTAVKDMPNLEQLELVNFDVKNGFDKALGACHNVKKLMIIPTYISQSATTNNMVLSGVLRLQKTLTHFVWGVTLELLRVTELFVDQCEEPKEKKEKKTSGNGDSIPVLKPVPDLSNSSHIVQASNPPQVEILPLPNLQKLLLNSLPTTRVKILKIPFHATWRQTLTDSV